MVQNGKQRVIITNISPQVENGAYPAKGAVGNATSLS